MDHYLKYLFGLKYEDSQSVCLELVGILLLFGLGIVYWSSYIYSPMWTPDGNNYQAVIDLVRQGRSPYEHDVYPYPPTIAVLGAWITELCGREAFRVGFRYVNLLGGFTAIWGSLFLTRWPWLVRIFLGGIAVLFLPNLVSGIENDNLSMLTSGTTIISLIIWPYIPVLAGITLGFGLALKPVALIGIFLLATHRPHTRHRKHLLTCSIAAVTTAILLSAAPKWFISGFFQPSVNVAVTDWMTAVINVSFYRILYCFGLKLSPFIYLALILLLGLIYVRRCSLNRNQLLCVACTASLLSLPIVWKHTLLLVFPVLCMAMEIALRRFYQAWKESYGKDGYMDRLRSLGQLLFVIAGCETVLEANGYGVIGNQHPWINGLMLMIPITALILLTGYVVRSEGVLSYD